MGRKHLESCALCLKLALVVLSQLDTFLTMRLEPDLPSFRLPESLKPSHYLIRLTPFINGNFSINGYVEVTFNVVKPTNKIVMHMRDIITRNETAQLRSVKDGIAELKIMQQEYDPDTEFYTVKLEKQLEPGMTCVYSVHYQAYLSDNIGGFYRLAYNDSGIKKHLGLTQFTPESARAAFPCFDEPALRAQFTVEIGRENRMTAISNMPLKDTIPLDGVPGWSLDRFLTSVPMATHLVAFVVSDFEHVHTSGNPMFRVWARKDALNQTGYIDEKGRKYLAYFENYFGVKFPLPKQDIIAVPDVYHEATHNWGLITARENAILADRATLAARDVIKVSQLLLGQLSKQWFGSLVGPSWWTDLWLTEAFATYMTFLAMEQAEQTIGALDLFVVQHMFDSLEIDSLVSSHQINIPVCYPEQIYETQDSLSFNKGAALIRMAMHVVTEKTVKEGIRNYLEAMKYSSSAHGDLWQYVTDQGYRDGTLDPSQSLKNSLAGWEDQVGYPVVSVKRKEGEAQFTQERFLRLKPTRVISTYGHRWWVPVSFISKSNRTVESVRPAFWLPPATSVNLTGMPPLNDWIVVNVNAHGFYRVNYELNNWNALAQQLNTDPEVIPPLSRAMLIDDAFSLQAADLLADEVVIDLISYLSKEKDYVPTKTAIKHLNFLDLMYIGTEYSEMFRKFARSLIVPLYEQVGFKDGLQDPLLHQLRREAIVDMACRLRHQHCIDNSVALYKEWMKNPSIGSLISPNVKRTVCCYAVKNGGKDEWQFALDMYRKTTAAAQKQNLFAALGCTEDVGLAKSLLDMLLDPDFGAPVEDVLLALESLVDSETNPRLVWNDMKENFQNYIDLSYSTSEVLDLVAVVISRFKTKDDLKELEHLRSLQKILQQSGTRLLDQRVETIKVRNKWIDLHSKPTAERIMNKGFSV